MSFNFLMTKRVFRVGQYDGIHDFVAFDLSGKKRALGEFLVGKFHSSAICKHFDPLVAHSAPPSGDPFRDNTRQAPKMYESSVVWPLAHCLRNQRFHSSAKRKAMMSEMGIINNNVFESAIKHRQSLIFDSFRAERAIVLSDNPVALAGEVLKFPSVHDLHCATGVLDEPLLLQDSSGHAHARPICP
jgi:hypothetical protein